MSGSGSQVYIIVSGTGTNYYFQLFRCIEHLGVDDVTTDNNGIRIFHCVKQLNFICIFLKQSQFKSGSFYFFLDAIHRNLGKWLFGCNKYFHFSYSILGEFTTEDTANTKCRHSREPCILSVCSVVKSHY